MSINEVLYYNETGNLYPLDIRHSPEQRHFFDPTPDGQVKIRVQTEPGFSEVVIVFNSGKPKAQKLSLWTETHRFQYWITEIHPKRSQFQYYIALKHQNGSVAYLGPTGTTGAAEFYFQVDLDTFESFTTPSWMHGAIMYQIFPERFANGNPLINPPGSEPWGTPPKSFQFQGGDLIGILNQLDYLENLGIEVLYLNPIFASPSNHKYDCTDYYNVDPAFGGNDALRDLVNGLHQRDMKIILDASFNHCHPNFFAFQDIVDKGRDSKYWDWFSIHDYPLKVHARPHLIPPEQKERIKYYESWFRKFEEDTGIPVIVVDDDGPILDPSYDSWMQVLTMPKINLSNPETRKYFLDVTHFWINEFKIDGWRMDVVPHVIPDFWSDFRKTAKLANPDVVLISEIWGNASFWLQGNYFDCTMNYTFRSLALEYFAKSRMSTEKMVDGCKHMLMMYADDITHVSQNLISSHDTARFLHESEEDIKRLRMATFFQLTMPGAPSIYYGDEIGLTGAHDPDCRRAFPWGKDDSWDGATFEITQKLIQLRKKYPSLRIGDWNAVWWDDEAFAFIREDGEQRILVSISRNSSIQNATIPIETHSPELLHGEAEVIVVDSGLNIVRQQPWSGVIILL